MPRPIRALALSLRHAEYWLLLPLVFAATWVEHLPGEARHQLGVAAISVAMMIAAICSVSIIRTLYM